MPNNKIQKLKKRIGRMQKRIFSLNSTVNELRLASNKINDIAENALKHKIVDNERDIDVVIEACGCDREIALNALRNTKGDMVNAIMEISQEQEHKNYKHTGTEECPECDGELNLKCVEYEYYHGHKYEEECTPNNCRRFRDDD